MPRIGSAYVEVEGNFERLGRSAEKDLNKALKELGKHADWRDLVDSAGDAGSESGKHFSETFEKTAKAKVKYVARHAAAEVVEEFVDTLDEGSTRSKMGSAFAGLFRGLGTGVAGPTSLAGGAEGFGSFVKAIQGGSGIASALAGVASSMSGFLITAGLWIAIAPFLVSAIIAVAGALSTLLGFVVALPAGIGVLVGAIVPLVVAFKGFSDAIEALASGDKDKIDAALKKLTPAAAGVAKEIGVVLPLLRRIQKAAQQAFFRPLLGGITAFFKIAGPGIAQGFANVAGAFGRLASGMLKLLGTPGVQTFFTRLFGDTKNAGAIATIIERLAPSLLHFLDALSAAGVAGIPMVIQLFKTFGSFLEEFGDVIMRSLQSEEFQSFWKQAVETGRQLWDLLVVILQLFGEIFSQTADGGRDFLTSVTEAVRKLLEFFRSEDGKRALAQMVQLAKDFGGFLKFAADWLITILRLFGQVSEAVNNFGRKLKDLQKNPVLGLLGGPLTNFLISKFAEGGVIDKPTLALAGEAGPEAVVPLNNPRRAAQVMRDAGLMKLLPGGDGAPEVHVYLGDEEIRNILRVEIRRALDAQARALAYGPRAA